VKKVALNTAPSFASGGNTLSNRVAKQRTAPRSPGIKSGMGSSPFQNIGFNGAKPMGNLGNPLTAGVGYNPTGRRTMGYAPGYGSGNGNVGGPIAQSPDSFRMQGDPLMAAESVPPMGGGMVGNTAPPIPGKSVTGGGLGIMAPQSGGISGPTEMGGIFGGYGRPRQMDPRFRY
jgi:hypothetical protein